MADVEESYAGRFCMILAFVLMVGSLDVLPAFADTVVRDWVAFHNGPGQSRDRVKAMTVDGMGNVYLTGYSRLLGESQLGDDFTTVKFDSAGNLLWAARYDGAAGYDNWAHSIAVDGAGNVVVSGAGYSGNDTNDDFATVKYDSEGNEIWVALYDGPMHGYDRALKVVADAAGNVYVTGTSQSVFAYHYVTIKYDPDGNEVWAVRYGEPWSEIDYEPVDLAVDALGNVLVTGSRQGMSFVTVKYDPDGNETWVAIHSYGIPRAMALDTGGNVYVTGRGSGGMYRTVKYDEDGNELWSDQYEWPDAYSDDTEPNAIAVDAAGNVHVTGNVARHAYSLHYYFCGTIKYDTDGNVLWAVEYSGSSFERDKAVSLALDGAGNIYIAGAGSRYQNINDAGTRTDVSTDFLLIKYSSGGTLLAENHYNGTASDEDRASGLGMDAAGNVYVAGTSKGAGLDHLEDFAAVKYDADGNELWAARYQGQGNGVESLDRVYSTQADGSGNVLVTGSWAGHGFVTIKYAPSGSVLWEAHYEGSVDEHHPNSELTVDSSGNAYVAFSTCGTEPGYDYVTIKYDADGNEQWVARFDEASDQDDWVSALAVDSSGNVYVTGKSDYDPDDDLKEYATVKYDSGGNELWVARYRGPVHASYNGATALALDGSGNVYVTGISYGDGTGRDYATIKYDTSGNELWVVRYDGPDSDTDEPTAIGVDASGNVFVTGGSVGGGNGYKDYATVKYDPDGNELWVARYDGTAEDEDVAMDLTVDPSGNVYVTGHSTDTVTGVDFATFKYGPDGSLLWFHSWNNILFTWDGAHALVLDGLGHLYVTGKSRGIVGYDAVTIKYDLNGHPIWTTRYNRANGYDSGDCITLDPLNNVLYVGGTSYGGEDPDLDFMLIRYSQHEEQPWGPADVASAGMVGSATSADARSSLFCMLGVLAIPFVVVLIWSRRQNREKFGRR